MIKELQSNKVFHITPIFEKIEAYHPDEMRKLWVSGSRNWDIYLKLPTEINGESIASFLSRVPKQKDPEKQALLEKYLEELKATPLKICYYCTKKNFQSKAQYERHVLLNHNFQKLAYPNLPYLKAMNLKPHGCLWEA